MKGGGVGNRILKYLIYIQLLTYNMIENHLYYNK